MVEMLATVPARIFRLDRGTLQVGADADVTIFDPQRRCRFDLAASHSKSRNSPFDGWELHGAPVATVVAGQLYR